MNKLLVGLAGGILLLSKLSFADAQPTKILGKNKLEQAQIIFTSLAEQLFAQPTAKHLGQGEVLINLDTRSFFFPDLVRDAVDNSG